MILFYLGLIITAPFYGINYIIEKMEGTPILSCLLGLALSVKIIYATLFVSTDHIIFKVVGCILYLGIAWFFTIIVAFGESILDCVVLFLSMPFVSLYRFFQRKIHAEKARKFEENETKNNRKRRQYREKQSSMEEEYQKAKQEDEERARREEWEKAEEKRRWEEANRWFDSIFEDEEEETKRPPTPDEIAMSIMGLKPGFTKDELRLRRRELAKKYHPDQGGDPEILKKINAAYDRLEKIAK